MKGTLLLKQPCAQPGGPRPSRQAEPQLTALVPTRPSATLVPYLQLLRAGEGARVKLITKGHRPSQA